MGVCGCGDTAPMYQFPGPDGVTYALTIYESCHYCMTPAGVDIHRFSPEEASEWCDGVPSAPFVGYDRSDPTSAELAIPVLDPEQLLKALGVQREEDGDDEALGLDETELRYALPTAVHNTLNEWLSMGPGVGGDS